MNYLAHPQIAQWMALAPVYHKAATTNLRRPLPHEVGQPLTTLVKDGAGISAKSTNTVTHDCVIARNAQAIGMVNGLEVFNEWGIAPNVVAANYGQHVVDGLGVAFTAHRKTNPIRLLLLDDRVLGALGVAGDELRITVDWSDQPMIARKGGFPQWRGLFRVRPQYGRLCAGVRRALTGACLVKQS